MSSLKDPSTKPTKKSSAKATAASRPAQKPFKSTELVQTSDEEAADSSDALPTKRHAASVKSENPRSTLKNGTSLSDSKPALPEPTTATKRTIPSSSANRMTSSEKTSNKKRKSVQIPQVNGLGKAHGKESGEPASTVTKSLLRRKSPSASASGTESSDGESERRSVSPRKRRKISPSSDPAAKSSKDKHTARATKSSRHHTSSMSHIQEEEDSQSDDHENTSIASSDQNASESESQSESESESESGQESTPAASKKSDAPSKQKPTRQLLPYTPPPGFEPAINSSRTSSAQTKLFSPSNLQKKQIWHIAAPNSVPISAITEVAKQSVKDGSSMLSYKGADYGLISEAEDQSRTCLLLLPSGEDNQYKPAITGISMTLHLRQLINLPSISHDVGAEDAGTQVGGTISLSKPIEKPAPEQPEGLKMRYKPIGVLDSEESDFETRSRKPQKVPAPGVSTSTGSNPSPKKRKRDEIDNHESNEFSSPSKLPKMAAAAELVSSIPSSSPLKKTPRKPKSIHEQKLKGKEDEIESVPASKRFEPSQEVTKIAETPAKAKRIERPKKKLSTSDQISKSSPVKEDTKTKRSHPDELLQKAHSNQNVAANGMNGKASPSKTEKPAETPDEPSSANPKKKRRKHRTTAEQDNTIQDDNMAPGEGSPQLKISNPDKQAAMSNYDQQSSVLKGSPAKPQKKSKKGLNEHLPIPNGILQSANKDPPAQVLTPTARNSRDSPTKQSPIKVSEKSEKSSSQPILNTNGQLEPKNKSKHENETPEERKQRRDEKKRRKEARENAAQKA